MATYTFDKIEYGSNVYVLQDSGALQLTGGQVTGPVTFGDSIYVDDLTAGQLVVEGSASIVNNLQVNTINGVTVGSSPKFTDTVTTISTTGSGNAITAISASNGALTATKGTTFLTAHNTYTVSTSGTGNAVTAVSLSGTTFTVTKGATYSNNAGTITGVTAGTGLSGGGTSGTVTLNHSNSVTAQTTQAVYPIKIDAQGHISAYGTAVTPLTSHQTIKQDGVTGATGNHFGTCSIAAGTAAKTVSITAGTPTLEAGLRVVVKFSNANTASTPTLNVNSLGAKNIFHNGAQITTGSNKALLAGTVEFVYDGTQWQLVGNYIDTNTTYTIPTTAASKVTGISIADHGTTSVGSASGWNAGTASTWAFTGVTVANSISGAVDSTDSTQLNITLGTTTVQSKSSGSNSTVPSLTITSTTVVNGKSHSITDPGHTHTLS